MTAGVGPSPATRPLPLVLLASAALFINYVDRGNLATAASLIQEQLHLSATQLGLLLSAFFYSYVPAQPMIGWLAERFGAHRILGAGVAIWSLSTLFTGFAGGFVSLLLLRLMLGLGESAGFPCVSKLVAVAVEPSRIGLANGVIAFAYLVGPAVGTTLGGLLMNLFGWRVVFVLFGAVSLLWLWPWSRVRVAAPMPRADAPGADEPTYWQILRERGLWGAALGHFAANYNFYFCLAWLPYYLIKSRGFSMTSMAGLLGFAYLINAIAGLLGGWLCDAWIRSGRSASVIYKSMMALNHVVSIAAMIGMALLPLRGSIACLFAYEVVLGLSSPGIYAIPQIMAGPAATGRWVGVQNSCGNIAGIFAPWITGMLVDATGSFDSAFLLAALINVLGLVGWMWILPRVEPLRWNAAAA
ncbi:MAG TPA: MFS transporter [Steroidobacteraceae bacterium]|nr:MFS transporter [Steroidobacteraceae bacterium]